MDNCSVMDMDMVNSMFNEVVEVLETLGDAEHIDTTYRVLKSIRDQLDSLMVDQEGLTC
jgi:hypothetical protein